MFGMRKAHVRVVEDLHLLTESLQSSNSVRRVMGDARAEVLVAEDDKGVRESLVRGLRLEGYEVRAVADGLAAVEAVVEREPDVVVLDVMMPVLDGLAACRRLRARSRTLPILILTARHEIDDRIAGLDAGADDYLVKPFALGELAARLRALLRRSSITGSNDVLRVGDLALDPRSRVATRAGRTLDLTKTEFDLLELLLHNAGIVLTRETLYDRIWGIDFDTASRSLDVHVSYLRHKTEAAGDARLIDTVRGVGYVVRR
jgi:two-component system, OmpR family, response regulator MprA